MPSSDTSADSATGIARPRNADGFTRTLQQIFDGLAGNSRALAIAAVVLVILFGATFLIMGQREKGASEARGALYLAQKRYDSELQSLQPPPPPAPKPAGKDAKAAIPPTPPQEDVEYQALDVNSKFPETVKAYRQVVEKFPGSRSAFDARMALGHIFLRHGQAAPSETEFTQAVSSSPRGVERALALSAQGYAREAQGKLKEAIDSFNQSLAVGEDAVKGDVLLALARCYEGLNDSTNARATYDKVVSQLPNTEYARNAELYKAQLQ